METIEKINVFKQLHEVFLDMVLDDTWLCEEPIDEEEMRACWHWAVNLNVESVPEEKFEDEFGFTFKDLTGWWNKSVLKLEV